MSLVKVLIDSAKNKLSIRFWRVCYMADDMFSL